MEQDHPIVADEPAAMFTFQIEVSTADDTRLMAAGTVTRTENGTTVTYRHGLPSVGTSGRPGTLVFQAFGGPGKVYGPVVGSTSWEIRRELGAVIADPPKGRAGDFPVEYVVYRDGAFHIRCHGPASAYAVLKEHGCPSQWPGVCDLEASLSR